MLWKRDYSVGELEFLPPDLVDERGDRRLLIWRDIPHWAVVDAELHELLSGLNGEYSLSETLEAITGAERRHDVEHGLLALARAGVVSGTNQKADARPVQSPLIRNIALNLTRGCNLRCKFCYNLDNLSGDGSSELSAREIVSFLKSIRKHLDRKASLVILGGEPLLCSDKLLEVATYAMRAGFDMVVSTNGTLVTDDFSQWARRMRLQVQVSLDGHISELNDPIRGTGSFDRAINGIRTLVRSDAHTILSMVCHEGNFAHLEDFYDLALSLGVREARFIPLKRLGGASGGEFRPAPLRDMISAAYDMLLRRPELARLMGRDAFSITGNSCRYAARRESCGTGSQTFLLDADGALYPCLNTNTPEFAVANIRDPGFDFSSAWNSSPVLRNIRECASVCQADSACLKCPVKHWCLGGCHGETYAVTGSLSGRSPNCADNRRAIIEMFWILADNPELVRQSEITC